MCCRDCRELEGATKNARRQAEVQVEGERKIDFENEAVCQALLKGSYLTRYRKGFHLSKELKPSCGRFRMFIDMEHQILSLSIDGSDKM
ncbi:hypothetical protein Tco_0728962 [Tanacetum coccineum]|uniref:Uncharacterized protein n=1 Tax=Tanacetum coccineum TaxID=301880 RepID=A0ABQ4YPY5_9ASTR